MKAAACALSFLLAASCSNRREPAPPPAPMAPVRHDAAPPPTALGSVLLSMPVSAYHVSVVGGDDDVFYLLTATAAYRLEPERAPVTMPLDLGGGAAITRSAFVHWSDGAVVQTPVTGGAARRVATLRERPLQFVAAPSGDGFAWMARGRDGRVGIHRPDGKAIRAAYTSPGSIDAIAMLDDATIVFVEGLAGAQWHIGRLAAGGGAPTFTPMRRGRSPAMLAGRRDVTYYDRAGYEVRRLSADLQREETLSRNFICTPLAVAGARVYCGSVEGLFVLQPDAPPRRLVGGAMDRLITDLAAGPHRVVWVVDAGADRLEVRSLAL
jgi:hypothetical protein